MVWLYILLGTLKSKGPPRYPTPTPTEPWIFSNLPGMSKPGCSFLLFGTFVNLLTSGLTLPREPPQFLYWHLNKSQVCKGLPRPWRVPVFARL